MSILQSGITTTAAVTKRKQDTGHRIRVTIAATAAFITVATVAIYGAGYYLLPLEERPYSDKYEMLKPGGTIGLKLGILGTVLFFIIFLYAFRRLIPWLGRIGTARQWMDFHVIAGITAPIIIAFHASFKFQGIAGVAFWIMLTVALSGVIGRYLYAQIPRSLSAAELTLAELRAGEKELSDALLSQSMYSVERVDRALHVPTAEHIRKIGILHAVVEMISLDIALPFRLELYVAPR
jgi:cation transport ATPase